VVGGGSIDYDRAGHRQPDPHSGLSLRKSEMVRNARTRSATALETRAGRCESPAGHVAPDDQPHARYCVLPGARGVAWPGQAAGRGPRPGLPIPRQAFGRGAGTGDAHHADWQASRAIGAQSWQLPHGSHLKKHDQRSASKRSANASRSSRIPNQRRHRGQSDQPGPAVTQFIEPVSWTEGCPGQSRCARGAS
jgi:hypothetical protein